MDRGYYTGRRKNRLGSPGDHQKKDSPATHLNALISFLIDKSTLLWYDGNKTVNKGKKQRTARQRESRKAHKIICSCKSMDSFKNCCF
jgi:hypothetical protein